MILRVLQRNVDPGWKPWGGTKAFPSNVTIFGLSEDLRPRAASQSRTAGRRRQGGDRT